MLVNALRAQMLNNQSMLYSNQLKLISESTSTVISNGLPTEVVTESVHWSGLGSIQYERPRIQKSIADENQGTMEDPITIVCYVPFDAEPGESMMVVDVDGAIGPANQRYSQSRRPANVGGASVYWEVYLGLPSNA